MTYLHPQGGCNGRGYHREKITAASGRKEHVIMLSNTKKIIQNKINFICIYLKYSDSDGLLSVNTSAFHLSSS